MPLGARHKISKPACDPMGCLGSFHQRHYAEFETPVCVWFRTVA